MSPRSSNNLRAGLIDEMHLPTVPILLGSGERRFDHLDGGPVGSECIEFASSPAVAHTRFTHTPPDPSTPGA